MRNIYEIIEKNITIDLHKAESENYEYVYKRRIAFMFYQNRVYGIIEHTKRQLYKVTLTVNAPGRIAYTEMNVRTQKCYHPAFVLIKTVTDNNKLIYEMLDFQEIDAKVYSM